MREFELSIKYLARVILVVLQLHLLLQMNNRLVIAADLEDSLTKLFRLEVVILQEEDFSNFGEGLDVHRIVIQAKEVLVLRLF